MAKANIIYDLGTLLRLQSKVFEELTNKTNLCIGSAIHDALMENEEALLLNIGIGNLSISLTDMQCKFIPSKELKSTIKTCINTKIDPLELKLEQELADKLIEACEGAL